MAKNKKRHAAMTNIEPLQTKARINPPGNALTLSMEFTPNFMSNRAIDKISKSLWHRLRKSILDEREHVCEICGFLPEKTSDLDAHEDFRYRNDNTIHLARIALLCKRCHGCKHMDNSKRLENKRIWREGRVEILINHFCTVNDCTHAQFEQYFAAAEQERHDLEMKHNCQISAGQVHYGAFQSDICKALERRAASAKRRAAQEAFRESQLAPVDWITD